MNADLLDPIIVNKSSADSRSLIMPHQQEAVDAMADYFNTDSDISDRNGLVVMPTGSGKTYTAVTWLLSQCVSKGYRIVWLVHRQELVEQTFQEFRKQVPILRGSCIEKVRILPVSGQHLRMSMASKADIYVCCIASAANKHGYRFIQRMIGAQGKRRLVVVIDEAHHAVAGNYQKVLGRLTVLNPNRILLGLTATPYRMQESEQLCLQKMFNVDENIRAKIGKRGFVYEVTLNQLLASGFLAKPCYIPVKTDIIGDVEYDISDEDRLFFDKFGELSAKLKNQIARSSSRNQIILDEYLNNRKAYGKTLIFAVNQMHAEVLCDEFIKTGISCEFAVSDRSDSQDVIRRFKYGEFDVLINVQMLTEGSDVPDIQTVFLTRETNSDSLLMQMIGRGLRGEKAGGTKTANIVAFHDTWNRFMHWMDPGCLDVFEDENSDNNGAVQKLPLTVEIGSNEEGLNEMDLKYWERNNSEVSGETQLFPKDRFIEEENISSRDLYLKLYSLMKTNLTAKQGTARIPYGWYSVIDDDGSERIILVLDSQRDAYSKIESNIHNFAGKIDIDTFKNLFFKSIDPVPDDAEIGLLLDYAEETDSMPPYFTFEQREAFDLHELADWLKGRFKKDEDLENWLKEYYISKPVLQNIYKYFYAFKKTVLDAMSEKKDSILEAADERKDYTIVDNFFDLNAILNELKVGYPKMSFDRVVKISWSDEVTKKWCALCQQIPTDDGIYFQITVSRAFSSPNIDREIVKYLVFHEMLHASGWWNHDDDFHLREWSYPNSEELDGIIDTLCLEYNIEYSKRTKTPKLDFDAVHLHIQGTDTEVPCNTSNGQFNTKAEGVIAGFKYCRNCGNKLPQSSNFCDKCGRKLDY